MYGIRLQSSSLVHGGDAVTVGGLQEPTLGDDGGDVLCRGDVEGWVFNADTVRCHLLAIAVGDFARVTLLDGNFFTSGRLDVHG